MSQPAYVPHALAFKRAYAIKVQTGKVCRSDPSASQTHLLPSLCSEAQSGGQNHPPGLRWTVLLSHRGPGGSCPSTGAFQPEHQGDPVPEGTGGRRHGLGQQNHQTSPESCSATGQTGAAEEAPQGSGAVTVYYSTSSKTAVVSMYVVRNLEKNVIL